MKRKYILVAIVCFTFIFGAIGQDIHYSQFFNSPLNISPGLTGAFQGNQRITANLRQQWKTVPVDYRSLDLAYDHKHAPTDSTNNLNFGVILNYDIAGDVNLKNTGLNMFVSYGLRLSEKLKVMPGVSIGFAQRRFDYASVTTGNQWDGREFDPTIPAENIGAEDKSFVNISAGLNLNYMESDRSYVDFGVGFNNLNSPSQAFNAGANYDAVLARRFNLYGFGSLRVAKKVDLIANAILQNQAPAQEVLLNGQAKFYIDRGLSKAVFFGIGMRAGDAWYPMLAIQYENIYAAFSYDINNSPFDIATDGTGGPELAFRYTISSVPLYPAKPCPIY